MYTTLFKAVYFSCLDHLEKHFKFSINISLTYRIRQEDEQEPLYVSDTEEGKQIHGAWYCSIFVLFNLLYLLPLDLLLLSPTVLVSV